MRRNRSEVGALTDALVSGTRVPNPGPSAYERENGAVEPTPVGPIDRVPPPLFATGHTPDGEVRPDYARIVETVYAADAFRDYDDLERHLEVGEGRGDHATLREHLDKAEARARRAHRIYLGAKIEQVRWENAQKKVSAAMRAKAREALEGDEARTKRITNDDVDAKVVEMFPDEAAHQEEARAKLKGVVESMEHLVSRWNSKCGDLRTLLETLRK